ncbi:MAG TPA: hypothetical protein GXZ87_09250 [Bacteroidales bacterium]|nr:hypothetical protein [Bacteroidales bacterium]
MKQIRFSLLLALCLIVGISYSQQVTISPIPQSISWGEKAFSNNTSFYLTGAATADQDAVRLLKSKLNIGTSGVQIILGEKGDAAVAAYVDEIPEKNEGYFLKVEKGKVVIAGFDEAGTYYGVQSLLQILKSPDVMSVTIKDYPSVSERGIIEGFYGNPYSHQDRQDLFRFFGENKMNVYIYGPKDDPYHGFGNQWRDPYPADQAARMKELIDVAHENKVNFIWAVHPGNNINWTDDDGDGIVDDFVAAKDKFELMYDLGVRSFAVFFDDIGGIGADPKNQAKMMNYLTDEFVNKKGDVLPLLLCPTQYNQAWTSGDYLDILGTEMDKSVRIMWTGKSVVRMIDKETMDWINARIKRNAYIWLNYPVTDYVIDHLLMGPTYGNSKEIASQLSGFAANPMEYAEASKVSLYSVADYAWNMPQYDSDASWLRSMKYLMPENYDAFKIFCENNIDLGSTGHALRRDGESAIFKIVAEPFIETLTNGKYNESQKNALATQFKSFIDAADELNASTCNPAMITEIKPWLDVFKFMGLRGLKYLEMYQAFHKGDSVSFINKYLKAEKLFAEQGKIRSRDFEGSIKNPYPKPANEVVAPYLKNLKSQLVAQYRSKFNYRADVFPVLLLENGNYYIKYNGKYLTNRFTNARGGNPVFLENLDTINPQRQEWTIVVDPMTERYSIKNTQDNRYINERGDFGINPYEAAWHSYNLFRFNGKYAIQNAGNSGTNFWMSDGERIKASNDKELSNENFIFEIVPIGEDATNHPIISFDKPIYIKHKENFLTNTATATPSFQPFDATSEIKSQKWILSVDAETDRVKIESAADGRYLNEIGVLAVDRYSADWNTYIITESDGKYAIQNAGKAGRKFWNAGAKIEVSDLSASESYVFEFVSDKSETIAPKVKKSLFKRIFCRKNKIN